jgi:hypothetical protein
MTRRLKTAGDDKMIEEAGYDLSFKTYADMLGEFKSYVCFEELHD